MTRRHVTKQTVTHLTHLRQNMTRKILAIFADVVPVFAFDASFEKENLVVKNQSVM